MVLKKVLKKYDSTKKLFFPNMANRMRLYYAENYETKSIDPNLIVYETRDGKSIVDSPYAMFMYLASNPEYSDFIHIWILNSNNQELENSIPAELRDKVRFVYRNTLEYVDALLEAKYLISNSTFESFFVKRPDQIYINTWHGTPLKSMGFDIPGKVSHSQNVLRNFLMADYILSPNKHTSNIFIQSYKLDNVYPGKILEGGYPRIDLTLNSDKSNVIKKIRGFGTKIDSNKKTILFSPTWKGSSVNNAQDDIEQIVNETLKLVEEFSSQYNVLIKVHPFAFSRVKDDERIADYLVSDLIDANEVLSVVDLLVTDYSSIFFDFLVTNKPIVFYSWDKDLYNFERGMYLDQEELPGPTAENLTELMECIHNVEEYRLVYKKKYDLLAEKMVNYDDGKVTSKYIDYIFKGKTSPNLTIHTVESGKKKLLIFPGGMRNNGITSSLLNLVGNIDYNNYDVTIICNPITSDEINENLKSLDNHARVLFRFGIDILTKKEKLINKKFADNGVSKDKRNEYPTTGYKREMNRLTANINFDVAIDFSGYSYFWGRHILAANAQKHVAFMHNDLFSDSMREVDGKMPMYRDLHGLFSIYYQFDKLLSVSPMTRDVNYNNLKEFVTKEQMSYVYNSIDIDKILSPVKNSEEQNTLKIEKQLIKPSIDGPVECYKNIDSIIAKEHFMIDLLTSDILVQHASFEFDDTIYIKISVNNKYVGWITKENTEPRRVEVERIEDYHGFGTVATAFNYPIWRELRTNTDKDEIVTYARYFKNRYLEIEKVAYTSSGRYFLVKYDKKILGWMSPRPLKRLHKISRLSPLNQYFLNRMKQQEVQNPVLYTNKIEKVSYFVKVINKELNTIWSEPEGAIYSREVPFSEEYIDSYFKVSEIAYLNNIKYCRLCLSDGSFVGYIEEKDISYISEEEFLSETSIGDQEGLLLPKMDLSLQKVADFDDQLINFVNMGRLSPEKNQKSLIEAFAKFNKENPNSRLYILGMGPLKNELVDQVYHLEMEGKVILLGHIKNPFEFLKKIPYFVLPSFYEGQPMVLLEALTIGMKILASNIPANINVVGVDEKYGLLTKGTSVDEIYEGLKRISSYQDNFAIFDYKEYNQSAVENFYQEIQ
ncbi:CDP-glycerol glycerophosphotransferase family protein [Enterococcus olivae]